jgi:hypothetical protein
MPQPYEMPAAHYVARTYNGKSDGEIISYAHVRFDPGRRVPPKPSLDQLDGDYYMNGYSGEQDD